MAAFQTTPWRLICGILAVICLVLMAVSGILLKNCSECCSCQENWIGYQCNCYFISNERKTWAESRDFCVSQNSSLLQLQNKDELSFSNHIKFFYWIGLSYNEEQGLWQWEDGSALSPDLFSFSQLVNTRYCIIYSTSGSFMGEACQRENRYVCKKQLI
ncbi:natural killer cells antigen CD94 isoform X2 [Rhinolophus sinicus]|uniref:natural killer cells antigen CD94 isoform X2 n=1 Tax=Rhinolophus sinicus TaxID=89399 RepID=UPI003D797BB2